jgi:hypothetical protein
LTASELGHTSIVTVVHEVVNRVFSVAVFAALIMFKIEVATSESPGVNIFIHAEWLYTVLTSLPTGQPKAGELSAGVSAIPSPIPSQPFCEHETISKTDVSTFLIRSIVLEKPAYLKRMT